MKILHVMRTLKSGSRTGIAWLSYAAVYGAVLLLPTYAVVGAVR